jgi:hypothetical protein
VADDAAHAQSTRPAVVPYTTRWSGEQEPRAAVVARGGGPGVTFADETLGDRDRRGVLWQRAPHRPGTGRAEFGKVHPGRQRRAMRRLLCQVCAGPADRAEQGTLWLLPDYPEYHHDWPGWPERLATPEPPVCLPCARTAMRICPALRKKYVAIRVRHAALSGVRGVRYRPGSPRPIPVEDALVAFDDPAICWTVGAQLVRELLGCVVVDL